MYDIIIIGGGPAGMTAGLYAKRLGKSALVLEGENFGGRITASPKVENYPGFKPISGSALAESFLDQLLSLDVKIELEKVLSVVKKESFFEITSEYNNYTCKSVIIASGCRHKRLEIEDCYKNITSGISYCAVCDGVFYKNGGVAVAGGGNSALQEAIYLSSICKKVFLIHRKNAFKAEKSLVDCFKGRDNAELVTDSVITKLYGNGALEGIRIKNTVTCEERDIALSGLFVSIGHIPDTEVVKGILKTDEKGFIISDESCKTSLEGVFAAGDCRVKEIRQLSTAVSDGTISAVNACRYVDGI